MSRRAGWVGVVSLAAMLGPVLGAGRPEPSPPAGPRVPVALAWIAGGRLLVALREAKAVAVVDPRAGRVLAEWPLPIRPHSLAPAAEGSTVLVGGEDGEALVLDLSGRVLAEWPAGKGPTRVLPLGDGRVAVASLWDAAVRVVDEEHGRVVAVHSLPFPTGAMVRTPAGGVVVADAFGGRLARLVPGRAGSERVHAFDGVNLRALAVSGEGKELLVAHMEQEEPAPVTAANIDRGAILSSRLSAVLLADLDAEPQPGSPLARRQVVLDGPVHGAADPAALAVDAAGTQVLIALAGAHQVIRNDRTRGDASRDADGLLPLGHNQRLDVLEVGRTPVAIALDPSGSLAVTADSMSDTLSILRVADLSRIAVVPLGAAPPARTAAQRGEAHFLDGRRSHDRWMSCASCHGSGHTSGLNFDTRGDGGYGAPKNTPSLLGIGGTGPFAWTGSFPRLDDQIHQSLESSLRGPAPAPLAPAVADLRAYLESLPSPPPRRRRDDPAALRGSAVFHSRRCDTCHKPPLYTTAGVRDVGLDDGPGGHRRFNPPSLRGVAWSAPYFHDGRAWRLAEVLDRHTPEQSQPLTPAERDDLAAFLESL